MFRRARYQLGSLLLERKLEQIYILSPVLGDQDTPRLLLNSHDREYFTNRILLPVSDSKRSQAEATKPTKPSHILINNAAKIAKEHIKSQIADFKPDVAKATLLSQIDYLTKKAVVIWVEVPDDKSAYTIFETMNDRGLDLSATDLIKNHLLNLADDQLEHAESQWASMVAILESVQETEIVKDYVRQYWISRYGSTRSQELFSEIKDRTPNKTTGLELLSNLHASASRYVALLNPMHGFWEGYTERSRKNIATLCQLNLKQARPLLLAIAERFGKHDVEKILRLAVSWSVRFLVSGELGSGALEAEYGKNAQKVTAGEIKDANSLALAMASIVPADDTFQSAFETVQAAKAASARYYLRGLERQVAGEDEPENVPNDDQAEITLEHILPEEPDQGGWKQFNEEDRKQFTTRLGNMALLKRSANSGLNSDEFPNKKTVYKDSKYILTSELALLSDWNPSAVVERQKRLAAIAVKAWPIKL